MGRRTLLGRLLWAAQQVRLVRPLLRTPRVVILVVLTHSELAPPERSALSDQAKPSVRHPLLPQYAGNSYATAPCNRADSCGKQREVRRSPPHTPGSLRGGVAELGWCGSGWSGGVAVSPRRPADAYLPTKWAASGEACLPPTRRAGRDGTSRRGETTKTHPCADRRRKTNQNALDTYCGLYTSCGRLSVARKVGTSETEPS